MFRSDFLYIIITNLSEFDESAQLRIPFKKETPQVSTRRPLSRKNTILTHPNRRNRGNRQIRIRASQAHCLLPTNPGAVVEWSTILHSTKDLEIPAQGDAHQRCRTNSEQETQRVC